MRGNTHVLPDSRLSHRPDFRTQVVDWPLPDGRSVRCEAQLVFCANCGKEFGWVPRENTSFAFWLCNQCFETYGAVAGLMVEPDEEFNRKLEAEMMNRFGRGLTELELHALAEQGRLGSALEKLARESPFPGPKET